MFTGTVIPSGMLIGCSFITCQQWEGAVCMFTLSVAFLGFQLSGWWLSHLDVAPQYAGMLAGLSCSVANLAHIAAPFVRRQIITQVGWHTTSLCRY